MSCVTGGPGSGRRHSAVPDSPQLTRRVGERWAPLAGVGGQPGGRHLASGPPPDGHWACANALAGALGGRWQRRWRWTTEDRWSVGALDYGRPLATAPRPPPPFLLPSSFPLLPLLLLSPSPPAAAPAPEARENFLDRWRFRSGVGSPIGSVGVSVGGPIGGVGGRWHQIR